MTAEEIAPIWDLDMSALILSLEESIRASTEIQELEKIIAKVRRDYCVAVDV